MRVPRPRIHYVWFAILAVAGAGAVATISPSFAAVPLRAGAAAHGRFFGTALATGPLAEEAAYRSIAGTEFSQVTPENALKWDATEPTDNAYNFTGADQIVAFAQQNNQQVHGHTLVWHSQTPSWVQSLSATAMRAAMQDHIATVVGHYANNPAVVSWDVVNEAFDDNGGRRQSFWQSTLGDGYIADAFRFARAADPDARLCLNDYNVEGIGPKSTAMYDLVRSLRQQNVPIDCVGFQAHLGTQFGFPSQVQQNVQRFADLGVQVRFTELDVRSILPMDATKTATQDTYYTDIVNACLAVTACAGVTVWGFTDKYSWVPSTFSGQGSALLYDENYNPKPAYAAVSAALGSGSPSPSPSVSPSPSPSTSTTAPPPPGSGCTASYAQQGSWPGGFQGGVTVTNTGSTATTGWRVTVGFANGQQITQLWGGRTAQATSPYQISNETWNGTLGAGATATFGFLASWSGTNAAPTLACVRTP